MSASNLVTKYRCRSLHTNIAPQTRKKPPIQVFVSYICPYKLPLETSHQKSHIHTPDTFRAWFPHVLTWTAKLFFERLRVRDWNTDTLTLPARNTKKLLPAWLWTELTGSTLYYNDRKPSAGDLSGPGWLSNNDLSQFKIKLVISINPWSKKHHPYLRLMISFEPGFLTVNIAYIFT